MDNETLSQNCIDTILVDMHKNNLREIYFCMVDDCKHVKEIGRPCIYSFDRGAFQCSYTGKIVKTIRFNIEEHEYKTKW